MRRTGTLKCTAIFIAAGALGACASMPDPKPEIASARALVTQAEQSGAAEFASRDIETARDRLRLAEDADKAHRDDEAQRYADEASVNAKLAIARTDAAKAEQSAGESAKGVDALREEANRPAVNSTTTTTPATATTSRPPTTSTTTTTTTTPATPTTAPTTTTTTTPTP